MVIRGNSL